MKLRYFFSTVTIFFSISAAAATPDFGPFVQLAQDGKLAKAIEGLKGVEDAKFTYDKLHLKYFALGKWASDLQKNAEARDYLLNALKYGQTNAAHIHYLIGHTFKAENDLQKAAESFNRALDFSPAQNIVYQTRFEFSEIAIQSGKPARAREHLTYLEKRWRGTPNYPDVIWRLMGVEFKDNRRHLACRWARKLFARYPTHANVREWGVDLAQNKYDGKAIGCVASRREVRDRLRHLNLGGGSEQARKEIDFLREKARPSEKSEVDMLLVSYLENQGYPDEAMQILLKDYEQKKRSVGYQNLLGKVASRAGEYQTAVGAFYSAHKLSPRSKEGKNALFTAAFLSYQIQDYDGATRKFRELMDKFAGSGLARDARWHLAWLQYLKGDYAGAEASFTSLAKEKYYTRRRRVQRPFDNDRTRYWLAMSLVKQGKWPAATTYFSALAKDKSLSYYSLLAQNRLKQMPAAQLALSNRTLSSNGGEAEGTTVAKEEAELTDTASPQLLFSPTGEREGGAKNEDSEEAVQSSTLEGETPDAEAEVADAEDAAGPKLESGDEPDAPAAAESGDKVAVTAFRDPRLRERFQRAGDLTTLGLQDWAKWELFEIERRTSNKTYLKMLMEAYSKVGSYNRVSYISEIYFSGERNRLGFKDARELWTYNYPQAYEPSVERYAKQFKVPDALVLSIMRAESQFNKDALSPVGARGLMQVMPYTATRLAKLMGENDVRDEDLLIPDVNIRLGARYLSRLQKKFQNQIPLVAAGYNAGPHRVYSWLNTFGSLEMDEFIEHVPFVETRNYMKKVVRNFAIYNQLYGSKTDTLAWLTSTIPVRVSERPSPRENWEIVD